MALARAQERLRRHHRRRRRARPRHGLLPRARARAAQHRGAGKGLDRRRQHGPQHDHHPLQLPLGRIRGNLRAQPEAVGDAFERTQLQRHVLAARRDDAGAHGARRAGIQAPRARQPPRRHRQRMADRRGGQGLLPAAQHLAEAALSRARRGAATARRHGPARCRRVGLRARRERHGRRHHPELRGDRHSP